MSDVPASDPPPRLDAAWLHAPESRRVLAALTADGAPARFVGGCVRDALIEPGRDAADLDLCTPLPPERVTEHLAAAGIRVIPTGLKHGTVTALVGDHSYEITTLRRDVACDGRHADVAFTDDFVEDAARRDFTINAMSCDGDGRVYDPFGGWPDLEAGRVRFVGDPVRRIREDYLRILRYFRFFARFGGEKPDEAALQACAAEAAGIERLSGERIAAELSRLLMAPGAPRSLDLMAETGVLAHVLPVPVDTARLRRLIEVAPESDWILRLAACVRGRVKDPERMKALVGRLRLSNRDTERLSALWRAPLPDPRADQREHRRLIWRLGFPMVADLLRFAAAERGTDPAKLAERLAALAAWPVPELPIDGDDVLARGVPAGPKVGRLLTAVRHWWEHRDFAPDRAACLAKLDELTRETR